MDAPKTLQQAVIYFSDAGRCLSFAVAQRWPRGIFCPTCGRSDVSFLAAQGKWQCKSAHPKRQFGVKVGTIFEDSPLSLDKWFIAMWMIANCKNGVSSYEIHRAIGVTQKSAWFMLQRIRLAMEAGSLMKLDGEVEADETFVGGKARNMHAEKRERRITGTGCKDKTAVMGILKRGGEVRAMVVEGRTKAELQGAVRSNVEKGSKLFTDALMSCRGLGADYTHEVIDHAVKYVEGNVHTNGIENFWSLLKRGLGGTYVSVEPQHLHRYVAEQVFRYNNRKEAHDGRRFNLASSQIIGKRLTYSELTAKPLPVMN